MSVKDLTKNWTKKNLKKMGKAERADFVYEVIPEVIEFYIKKGFRAESKPLVDEIFNVMEDEKFVKTLKVIAKDSDNYTLDLGLAVLINDFLGKRMNNISEEMVSSYVKLIKKILKPRVKEITKKVDIDEKLLREFLVITPDPELVSSKKVVSIYSDRILNKLYALAGEDEEIMIDAKTIKKLFKHIFGEEALSKIAVGALLQRRDTLNRLKSQNQIKLWNNVTTFALNTLEKCEKEELLERLSFYYKTCNKAQQNGNNVARRIELSTLTKEDYPKIIKTLHKIGVIKKNNSNGQNAHEE